MADYIVTGEMAYLRRADGTEDVRYKGALLNAAEWDKDNIRHQLGVHIVEPLKSEPAEVAVPVAVVDPDNAEPVKLEREAVAEAEAERRSAAQADADETVVVASTPQDATDLDSLSVAELKLYASRHEINLGGATKRDDILTAIKTAAK